MKDQKTTQTVKTLLTNVSLIDGVNSEAILNASVLIENGRITEIFRSSCPKMEDAKIIDLKNAYLMAGLWDVHIHPDYIPPLRDTVTFSDQVIKFGHDLKEALCESGIVGFRTGGAYNYMDVTWKRAFESGQYLGPMVFAAGHFLTTTGGHYLGSGHAVECDGPYGFVKTIREQIKNGVDHIKLNLSGGIMGPSWDQHRHSFLLEEEMRAAFDICRLRDFKVMAHATNPVAVKAAIRLGAHTVEHGYIQDDECIDLFLERDVWYVPTLAISHLTPRQARTDWEKGWVMNKGMACSLCCRADAASDEHELAFKKALAAGVKMALGSDIRPLKDAALLEMGLWARHGASNWQILQAATRNAAELCGVGSTHGTVEVGKVADLIVVGGNPLMDISNVRLLQLVFKNGRIVSDKRTRQADVNAGQ